MHQHPDVALRNTHHGSHVGDRQIVHHSQHHRFGLVAGQRRHQLDGPVECVDAVVLDVGAKVVVI